MKLKNLLLIIGLIGLLIVVVINAHEFNSFVHLLRSLRWYIIVLIVLVQLFSYYVNALYYRSILKILGYMINLGRLFEAALAANFVNYVFPSMGLGGAGYLSQVLKPNVPRGIGVLTQFFRYAFSALAVLISMPIGLILLISDHNSSKTVIKVSIFSVIIIICFTTLIILLINHEKTLRKTAKRFSNLLLKITHKFKPQSLFKLIDEFYDGYKLMRKSKTAMIIPILWSIFYIFIEILTLYLTFIAFGKSVTVGMVIMAYALANIASTFGGVFISTGIFELGMVGTLVALGVALPLAISTTIVYRVMNLLIGLPLGFYFYRKYLSPVRVSKS